MLPQVVDLKMSLPNKVYILHPPVLRKSWWESAAQDNIEITQQTNIYSKSTIETPKKGVKYVQS